MGQGFENWSQAKIDEHNARVAAGAAAYKTGRTAASNIAIVKHLVENPDAKVVIATKETFLSIERRESTDIEKLNKTERAFYNLLITQGHQFVWVQAFSLKIADDRRYICDFIVLTKEGKLIGYETKGFRREKNMIKLKVAARMYPIFKFVLVSRKNGNWIYEDVKP